MRSKQSLFIFAHQDDEFGVFSEIERKIQGNERVFILYLTSGGPTGAGTPRRDAESLRILKRMGVQERDIFFLGSTLAIPDGKLVEYLDPAWRALQDLWHQLGGVDDLYVLAWEGGHQDHDAAHLLGVALASCHGILARCHQFCLYTGRGLAGSLFRLFAPDPANGPLHVTRIPWQKRWCHLQFVLMYPSQVKTWMGLFPFFLFHYLFRGTQVLQPVSLDRLNEAPHPGSLLYERRGFYRRIDFSQHATQFLRQRQ
ncbi:PIG-L deacetylase family protein [Silvimonas terrae]|nr:PIG-L family deacetylase [Silvimonas terrae]